MVGLASSSRRLQERACLPSIRVRSRLYSSACVELAARAPAALSTRQLRVREPEARSSLRPLRLVASASSTCWALCK